MSERGRVGPVARALGFAGLLPQVAAVVAIAVMRHDAGFGMLLAPVVLLAVAYPFIILSFLGGMWWSFAVRRGAGQARLAIVAVAPSLAALALVLVAAANIDRLAWPLVALGAAIMLTLLVDRRLMDAGEAPEGWMRLRVPLSLGLGILTIAAGALLGS